MKCPACQADNEFKLITNWREYRIYHCHLCDVVFFDPMKSPGAGWYETSEGYVNHNLINRLLPVVPVWWHNQFLLDGSRYGVDLMDIGCGTGVFLAEAKKLGYNVYGLDFNSESIEIARKRFGLKDVENKSVESFFEKNPGKKFDVCTFFEVLEHIEDPNQFISQVKHLLKPGGHIAMSVPNRERSFDTLREEDFPPNHFTRWSAKSLRNFLEKNGFEVKKLHIQEFTVDDLINYFFQEKLSRFKGRIAEEVDKASASRTAPPLVYRQYFLLKKIKNAVLKTMFLPAVPFLKVFKQSGYHMYCLAKLKDNK